MKRIDEMTAEHLRRMDAPDYLRRLRDQADRIEREHARQVQAFINENEAERLRRAIRKSGEEPVA